MEKIIYVTGNFGKYQNVKRHAERVGFAILFKTLELVEPEVNDVSYISREKARQAYKLLHQPVMVTDTGFYIEDFPNYPGYPGAFVKREGISTNIQKVLKLMKGVSNRNCYFLDCLTFYDGKNYYQFYETCRGHLLEEARGIPRKEAKSPLWEIFVPLNYQKTLAEMSDEERENRYDRDCNPIVQFIKWYTSYYQKLERNK